MNVVIFIVLEISLVCKKCSNFCRHISDISLNLFLPFYLVTFLRLESQKLLYLFFYLVCCLESSFVETLNRYALSEVSTKTLIHDVLDCFYSIKIKKENSICYSRNLIR